MKSISTRAALLLLMAAAAFSAHAQHEKFPTFLKQYEIGGGLAYGGAEYILTPRGVTPGGKDTTITKSTHVSSTHGIYGTTGTSFKLKRLGSKSTLALGVQLAYTGYTWNFNQPSRMTLTDSGFKYYYDNNSLPFDGATLDAGLALTADFKFGVDAMMDKMYRWGWTIGVGVIPSASATAVSGVDLKYAFGAQPIIKGEVALRAGIVMKLRMQYSFMNLTYFDYSGDGLAPNTKQQTQIIGKGNFSISYILMPFSFMYKTSTWYNND